MEQGTDGIPLEVDEEPPRESPPRGADTGSLIEWPLRSAARKASPVSRSGKSELTPFAIDDILNEIVAEYNQKVDELSRLITDLPKRLRILVTQSTGVARDFEMQGDQSPGELERPHRQNASVRSSGLAMRSDDYDACITSYNVHHVKPPTPTRYTHNFDADSTSYNVHQVTPPTPTHHTPGLFSRPESEGSQIQSVEGDACDTDSAATSAATPVPEPSVSKLRVQRSFDALTRRSLLPEHWMHLVHMDQINRASDMLRAVPDFTQRMAYQIFICLTILANMVYIGVEAEYEAEHFEKLDRSQLNLIIFTAIYVFDLSARLWFENRSFFAGKEAIWNLIDSSVVACAVFELCLHFLGIVLSLGGWILLRALRLLRLVRFLQAARFLKTPRGFRTLLSSVRQVMETTACTVVACCVWIYIFAVTIALGSLEHCDRRNVHRDMCRKFGKPSNALENMFKIMFHGILWGDSFDLLEQIGGFYQAILGFFVTSNILIVLSLALGVVARIVNEVSKKETENIIDIHLRDLNDFAKTLNSIFDELDVDGSGGICLEELVYASQNIRMIAWLESVGLSVGDLEGFFDLLDRDRTGIVDLNAFVLGCLRLKGEARKADLMKLQLRAEWLLRNVDSLHQKVDDMTQGCRLSSTIPTGAGARVPIAKTKLVATPVYILTDEDFQDWSVVNETENRAMTLQNLKSTLHFAEAQCVAHKWPDPNDADGRKLQPTMINLYNFTYHCISPLSAPHGVLLHGLGACCKDQVVVQPENSSSKKMQAVGKVLDLLEGGVVHVQLLEGRFVEEMRVMVNGVDVGEPSRIEVRVSLSWKELAFGSPAKPRWFCSHWWGEPISEFVACCERHTTLRGLNGVESTYWVCAYANRQHELAADINDDPAKSSFHKAMQMAEGTLLLLNNEAMPFKRIWCCFEMYNTIISEKPLDVVTACSADGRQEPQLLTQGLLTGETGYMKLEREESFPLDVLLVGLRSRLEDGKSSCELDKQAILRYMSKDIDRAPHDHSVAVSLALKRANHQLHSYLAMAAWPQALKKGYVADLDLKGERLVLQDVTQRDDTMKNMQMSFAYIDEMTDVAIQCVADGLPRGLVRLQLSFEGCSRITDRGLDSLSERLPSHLESLSLNFLGCKMIGNKGLAALAQQLPESLQDLRLDFAHCELVSFQGVQAIAHHVPASVKRFAATFQGTEVNCGFRSATELRRFVRRSRRDSPASLDLSQAINFSSQRSSISQLSHTVSGIFRTS